jgi:chemotaxis protein MotB
MLNPSFFRKDPPTDEEGSRLRDAGQQPGSQDYGVPLPGRMPKTLHWSIPWSDLMMTMFIFFAILYFYQTHSSQIVSGEGKPLGLTDHATSHVNIDRAGPRSIPATARESMSSLYHLSKKTVEANDLKDFASVDLVRDKAVRIVLAADLLFDTGQAEIKREAKASLKDVADIIRSTSHVVNIVGHTDDVPINSKQFPTNWELSVMRATQVARFLIEAMGISGSRFFVTGHAYHQPVKPNTSAKNRAANRRVEIIITKDRPRGISEKGEEFPIAPGWSGAAIPSEEDHWPWNTF